MPSVYVAALRRDQEAGTKEPFAYGYEWRCESPGCDTRPSLNEALTGESRPGERRVTGTPSPARLFIRARQPRSEGPSNYDPRFQPSQLNWNGLAEERGWVTAPKVICPACQRGMSPKDLRTARAQIRVALAKAQETIERATPAPKGRVRQAINRFLPTPSSSDVSEATKNLEALREQAKKLGL